MNSLENCHQGRRAGWRQFGSVLCIPLRSSKLVPPAGVEGGGGRGLFSSRKVFPQHRLCGEGAKSSFSHQSSLSFASQSLLFWGLTQWEGSCFLKKSQVREVARWVGARAERLAPQTCGVVHLHRTKNGRTWTAQFRSFHLSFNHSPFPQHPAKFPRLPEAVSGTRGIGCKHNVLALWSSHCGVQAIRHLIVERRNPRA